MPDQHHERRTSDTPDSDRYEFIGAVEKYVDHPTVSGMKQGTRLYACLLCSGVIVSQDVHATVCSTTDQPLQSAAHRDPEADDG